ncbi:hypothetical protein [Synechococcus sp. UW179A]|uniref:hypothetical protein n=1 Tax=Synechococcus sp. UW179A TaxID=2575510 RepID=UPI0010BE7CB6|nr:hypothetical protein [Synechococcus sp. UW179A]
MAEAQTNLGLRSKGKGKARIRNRGSSQAMKKLASNSNTKNQKDYQNGYVLPLVIITGMILVVGAAMISARSFSGMIRWGQQKHREEAVEIAEAGVAIILNKLNNDYPYLLVEDCDLENNNCSEWNTQTVSVTGGPSSACVGRETDPSTILSSLNQNIQTGKGAYRLQRYKFFSDPSQGGYATIQVQGQRFQKPNDPSQISASAVVEQEITIIPKWCSYPPYTGIWNFGLATDRVQLQLGDVIGDKADVHCSTCGQPPKKKCTEWSGSGQIIRNSNQCSDVGSGIIDGKRSSGSMALPTAPQWNISSWGDPTPINIGPGNNPVFTHGTVGGQHPIRGCITTNNNGRNITHCRIDNINLSGNSAIKIQPGTGDIRFYIEGLQVNLSGNSIINASGKFDQFAMYGGVSTTAWKAYGCNGKSMNISGEGTIYAFLHMPCFNINLSGGTQAQPLQITGSAIAKQWNATGDYARLNVPAEAGLKICSIYNVCSSMTRPDEYSGLGSYEVRLIE